VYPHDLDADGGAFPRRHPPRMMPPAGSPAEAQMMADYDVLAPHYDAVTGDSATEAALIREILERRHGGVTTLLDVACGTGAITALLSPAYQVSGLDISPGMLAAAREKLAAETPLYLADMTSFTLSARFDAIVCAYQGVNHLLSLSAWKSFFGCAYRHLNPGGVFVFDVATVRYLMTMASTPKIVQPFAGHYLLITVRTPDGVTFEWHIEVFELQRDGRYRLLTQVVRMRSFPVGEIKAALRRRFTGIEVIGGDGNSVDRDGADRIWLACAKPA
jgi:SAM-dependent methyltransferase